MKLPSTYPTHLIGYTSIALFFSFLQNKGFYSSSKATPKISPHIASCDNGLIEKGDIQKISKVKLIKEEAHKDLQNYIFNTKSKAQ